MDLLAPLVASLSAEDNAWISCITAEQLELQLSDLVQRLAAVQQDLSRFPLYGIPFAVKDSQG